MNEEQIIVDEWHNLYKETWLGVIPREAFGHPAKFSRALIRQIYIHAIEEGWLSPGDTVVDPFGGIALGALDALQLGLNWIGCELEPPYAKLGRENIDLWNGRFSTMANWGTACLVQGDSRNLREVLHGAGISITSPPYSVDALGHGGGPITKLDKAKRLHTRLNNAKYGEGTPGQLGEMKEGSLSLTLTSPPYAQHLASQRNGIDWAKLNDGGKRRTESRDRLGCNYGDSPGQLSSMPPGDFDCAITSSPFITARQDTTRSHASPSQTGDVVDRQHTANNKYGEETEGQMAAMKEGDVELVISSPPYNPPMAQDHNGSRGGLRGVTPSEPRAPVRYGNTEGQLEGMAMAGEGETFWSAARQIVEELYLTLAPGAHAIFVAKAFVRKGQIVDFPEQWARLCEAVGFRFLHNHRALLTEHYGVQQTLDGGDHEVKIKRASFFRRLAESKGSPPIDWEDVLCFVKD